MGKYYKCPHCAGTGIVCYAWDVKRMRSVEVDMERYLNLPLMRSDEAFERRIRWIKDFRGPCPHCIDGHIPKNKENREMMEYRNAFLYGKKF